MYWQETSSTNLRKENEGDPLVVFDARFRFDFVRFRNVIFVGERHEVRVVHPTQTLCVLRPWSMKVSRNPTVYRIAQDVLAWRHQNCKRHLIDQKKICSPNCINKGIQYKVEKYYLNFMLGCKALTKMATVTRLLRLSTKSSSKWRRFCLDVATDNKLLTILKSSTQWRHNFFKCK